MGWAKYQEDIVSRWVHDNLSKATPKRTPRKAYPVVATARRLTRAVPAATGQPIRRRRQ